MELHQQLGRLEDDFASLNALYTSLVDAHGVATADLEHTKEELKASGGMGGGLHLCSPLRALFYALAC